ncbi:MAG: hypothetical protein II458_03945 [Oscillospiraceae bacterium]|nr:hypothetical protein [Oscillospiraceae bacterium]
MDNKSMHCPVCSQEMASGAVYTGPLNEPAAVKWLDDRDEKSEEFVLPYRIFQCFGEGNKVFFCPDCGVIVTKVYERTNYTKAVADKLKNFTENVANARAHYAEERREARQKKARSARRKKDPWEG